MAFYKTDKKRPIKITEDMQAYGVESTEPLEIEDIRQLSTIDTEKNFT